MPAQDIATAHYLQPAVMTTPGSYQSLFTDLPRGIASLAVVAHGLLIHEHITGPYGVTLTDERRASVHVRPVAGLLARMMAEDSRPLTVAREPVNRLSGNCRQEVQQIYKARRPCPRTPHARHNHHGVSLPFST